MQNHISAHRSEAGRYSNALSPSPRGRRRWYFSGCRIGTSSELRPDRGFPPRRLPHLEGRPPALRCRRRYPAGFLPDPGAPFPEDESHGCRWALSHWADFPSVPCWGPSPGWSDAPHPYSAHPWVAAGRSQWGHEAAPGVNYPRGAASRQGAQQGSNRGSSVLFYSVNSS